MVAIFIHIGLVLVCRDSFALIGLPMIALTQCSAFQIKPKNIRGRGSIMKLGPTPTLDCQLWKSYVNGPLSFLVRLLLMFPGKIFPI